MENYVLTSESVTEGHPDKVCDLIADTLLDAYLEQDKNARVAIEVMALRNKMIVAGEVTANASINVESIVRDVLQAIGYNNEKIDMDYRTCEIEKNIKAQSRDIGMGVDLGGAGDQGMMFGYACDETKEYMPLGIMLSHQLAKRLTEVRKEKILPYLRPDGKVQVTVNYKNNTPVGIKDILISAQHTEEISLEIIRKDIIKEVIRKNNTKRDYR